MAFASLVVKISGEISSLDKTLKTAVERVKRMGSDLSSLGSSLALGLSAPLAGFGALAIKSAADLEALKMGLTAVTGSAKAAAVQFEQLKEVAKLPGLGFQEAVRGATNLQAIGFQFAQSKNILLQFGNALASVGRGREDLEEVIRQLGQMASRGKVTADNLKPIMERVPQVAAIIKREFGTIDTEALQKMGISATKLISTLELELGKLPRVTGGLKNDLENMRDSISFAFAAAGEALAPFAKKFIDDFAVPALEKLKLLAEGFKALPGPIQGVAVALGGIAIAGPLAIAATGSLLSNFALMTEAVTKLGGGVALLGKALSAIPWLLVAAEVINALNALNGADNAARALAASEKDLEKSIDKTIVALKKQGVAVDEANRFKVIPARVMKFAGENVEVMAAQKGTETTKEFIKYLNELAVAQGKTVKPTKDSTGAITEFGAALKFVSDGMLQAREHFAKQTTESQVLARMMGILNQGHEEFIEKLARTRLGLHLVWDEAPQFDILSDKVKGLGDELFFVGGEARRAAAALQLVTLPSDLGKLGVLQNKQRGGFFDREFDDAVNKGKEAFKESAAQAKRYSQQVSLVANDIARSITDLTFKGGKLGEVMKGAFIEISKGILRSALETQFKRIVGLLVDITTKAPAVQRALSAIFGLGGSAASGAGQAAGQVAGAAGSAASTAASAGGPAATAASSGLLGIVGVVAQVGTLVSSIVGNFQFAGINRSLDIIVKHTLQTANQLIYGIQPALNTYLPYLKLIHERSFEAGFSGGGQTTYSFDLRGATFGAGITREMVESLFTEAARRKALAGA